MKRYGSQGLGGSPGPQAYSPLNMLEMATWHSDVLATCHIGVTRVSATCHARGCKRAHKSERHNRRKAQDACRDVFHRKSPNLNLRQVAIISLSLVYCGLVKGIISDSAVSCHYKECSFGTRLKVFLSIYEMLHWEPSRTTKQVGQRRAICFWMDLFMNISRAVLPTQARDSSGLTNTFKPQPYRQLAKVLRATGDDDGAK